MKNLFLLFVISLAAFTLAQGQCIVVDPRLAYPDKEIFLSGADHPKRPADIDFTAEYDYPLDQGNSGSCVAQGLTEGMSRQKAVKVGWNFRAHSSTENLGHHFSPSYFNPLYGPEPGLEYPNTLEYVCQNGGVFLSDMAYNPDDDTTMPSDNMTCRGLYYHEDSWGYTQDLETALNGLYQYGGVYTYFQHVSGSAHAVVLVGYDDWHDNGDGTFGAWKYANSVGRNWGEDGFGWISYWDSQLVESYYYFLIDRPDHRPALVFRLDFNLASKAKAFSLDATAKLSHFYFLNGSDTIKKIDLAPVLDRFFLPVEFRSDIGSANKLVIESDINTWTTSGSIPFWGFNMAFYGASSYDWATETFKSLNFDTITTRLLLDSLIISPGNNLYQIFNGFNVPIDLTASNGVSEKGEAGAFYNYPNPAYDQTTFVFSLTEESQARLRIINSAGVEVMSLEKTFSAGEQRMLLPLKLSPGLYLAELSAGKQKAIRKFLVKS